MSDYQVERNIATFRRFTRSYQHRKFLLSCTACPYAYTVPGVISAHDATYLDSKISRWPADTLILRNRKTSCIDVEIDFSKLRQILDDHLATHLARCATCSCPIGHSRRSRARHKATNACSAIARVVAFERSDLVESSVSTEIARAIQGLYIELTDTEYDTAKLQHIAAEAALTQQELRKKLGLLIGPSNIEFAPAIVQRLNILIHRQADYLSKLTDFANANSEQRELIVLFEELQRE